MPDLPLADIRKDYQSATLNEADVFPDPFQQFRKWFNEVLDSRIDESNAMTLATADAAGHPSARIVLLKDFTDQGFYFFTNYESAKARDLQQNPHAALVFFWKELERQVRIQGQVAQAEAAQSDAYFFSRPEGSRIGAWSSPQSKVIPDRHFLEAEEHKLKEHFQQEPMKRPPFWGGYLLRPSVMEFWQGRSNRLHDRIRYSLSEDGSWRIERLAP